MLYAIFSLELKEDFLKKNIKIILVIFDIDWFWVCKIAWVIGMLCCKGELFPWINCPAIKR